MFIRALEIIPSRNILFGKLFLETAAGRVAPGTTAHPELRDFQIPTDDQSTGYNAISLSLTVHLCKFRLHLLPRAQPSRAEAFLPVLPQFLRSAVHRANHRPIGRLAVRFSHASYPADSLALIGESKL